MPKARLIWTVPALQDLEGIKRHIAREAPRVAVKFVKELKRAAARLKDFPQLGAEVPEFGNPELREIVHGNYRVVYRYRQGTVTILVVFHGARRLDERLLPP